jgi:geranylgeranyl pyrophosphate synthase
VCVRIAETGSLEDTRARALELAASAKTELPDMPARQRGALELIADGVVERYS